jgi:hypothetical protein
VRTLHDEVETERQVALDEAGAQRERERERAMWRIDRGDAESAEGLSAADTLAGTGRFRRNRPSSHPGEAATRRALDFQICCLPIASHTRKACDELDQFNPHKQLRNVRS